MPINTSFETADKLLILLFLIISIHLLLIQIGNDSSIFQQNVASGS
jgi:hypothetical protein